MTTDTQLVHQAKQALNRGKRSEAGRHLQNALKLNPNNAHAWAMLATLAPPEKRQGYFARAQAIAPRDRLVLQVARWLEQQSPSRPPAPPSSNKRQTKQQTKQHKSGRSRLLYGLAIVAVALIMATIISWQWMATQQTASPPPSPENIAAVEPEAVSTATPTPIPTAIPSAIPSRELTIVSQVQETPVAFPTKNVGVQADKPRPRWTATPEPTNTPLPTATPIPTFVADNFTGIGWPNIGVNERWIDVNLTTQKLIAYEGYTAVKETKISSGLAPNYTVTGQFRIYLRFEKQTMDGRRLGFDYVTPNVPHVQYFYGDFALHGAFWHNNFGQPMSHGCVNLNLADAEWLFDWAGYGTLVNVHY